MRQHVACHDGWAMLHQKSFALSMVIGCIRLDGSAHTVSACWMSVQVAGCACGGPPRAVGVRGCGGVNKCVGSVVHCCAGKQHISGIDKAVEAVSAFGSCAKTATLAPDVHLLLCRGPFCSQCSHTGKGLSCAGALRPLSSAASACCSTAFVFPMMAREMLLIPPDVLCPYASLAAAATAALAHCIQPGTGSACRPLPSGDYQRLLPRLGWTETSNITDRHY